MLAYVLQEARSETDEVHGQTLTYIRNLPGTIVSIKGTQSSTSKVDGTQRHLEETSIAL